MSDLEEAYTAASPILEEDNATGSLVIEHQEAAGEESGFNEGSVTENGPQESVESGNISNNAASSMQQCGHGLERVELECSSFLEVSNAEPENFLESKGKNSHADQNKENALARCDVDVHVDEESLQESETSKQCREYEDSTEEHKEQTAIKVDHESNNISRHHHGDKCDNLATDSGYMLVGPIQGKLSGDDSNSSSSTSVDGSKSSVPIETSGKASEDSGKATKNDVEFNLTNESKQAKPNEEEDISRQLTQKNEKTADSKSATPDKSVKEQNDIKTPEKGTKVSKERFETDTTCTSRYDTPGKDIKWSESGKINSSPLKQGQSPGAKSPAGNMGKERMPTKQRYSEQRQRKSATRGSDRTEKRDGKGKESHIRKEQSSYVIPSSVSVAKPNGPTAAELEAKWQKEEEEKKLKEEEKRKEEERLKEEKLKEEERIRAEEEKRRKVEEEQRKLDEELKTLDDYIAEAGEKIQMKAEHREKNVSAAENRPDDSFFCKLDSNLKKNTAFVKKLKNLTDSQKESLMKDFSSLNLSKYIGECAAAIAEAKLKMSDVNCGVILSSLFHQRYAEFSNALLDNWQKFLLNKKDEKIPNPSKYRVDLRFFAELLSVRVFTRKEGLSILSNQLSLLVNSDKEEHNNLSTISSFCKHCGDDYAGLIPRKIRELAEKHSKEIPRSQVLPPERQKACRNLLKDYYQSLCKHLTKDHKDLKSLEKQNLRTLQTKGELSGEKKEMYESALTSYQKLHGNTAVLSDLLDEDMPDLPEEDFKQDPESAAFDVFNPMRNAEYQYEGDTNLFEDEETRSFYENLPDLKAFIPGILYKESEQATTKDAVKDMDTGMDEENLAVEDVEKEMETEKSLAEIEQQALDKEEQENPGSASLAEDEYLPLHMSVPDDDDGETASLMKSQFEAYLQSLPNCVNRELIDKAAVEFCMNFNTKSNRKKLVKALFTVHRTRYDLLPFYSRYVATLYPCMPDVANDLVQLIKGDFKWHVRKKDQINIESKLKTVRFMGEMAKFNMFPKSEALHCLKMLMFAFSHHNIEMACSLLETCGRYLYRSPESHHRTKVYLDVMMRKKTALHLDGRYITMIENAYYYSNPPDTPQMVHKERPPLHEYIRKLLYKDLSKTSTEKVLRQMRKLDWDNQQVALYATKCLTAVWNVRYNSIHCMANLLAGLAPYHEIVAIQVVDGILEDIRIGMEINHPKYNQRRVSAIKYLGELYNYRMVESVVIFKTLYSFISFGVSLDESAPTQLDPAEHLFRLRLVCVLLDTCGQYFDKGSSKKKLDYFLVYFQRYYWFKRNCQLWTDDRPFPIDIMNMVQDTFETIRPKLKMQESYEAASKAAEELGNEFKTKLAKVLPPPEVKDAGDTGNNEDHGLTTIQESEENDELSQGLSQTPLTDDGPSTADSQLSDGHTGSQPIEGERRRSPVEEEEDILDSISFGERRRSPVEEEEDILESAGEDETDDQESYLVKKYKVGCHPEVMSQVTVLSGGPKYVNCTEDDDFMAAFDKMMSDNIQARNSESLKVPQLDIAVPMHLRGQKKTYFPQDHEQGSINFVLMTRKGNKQQFSNLNVPISEEFAAKFKERERAEKAEKERMKQVVLGIHERQEEEDYQEMIASMNRPVPVNTNRERRARYQHPKGAPDADLIFGSKKR